MEQEGAAISELLEKSCRWQAAHLQLLCKVQTLRCLAPAPSAGIQIAVDITIDSPLLPLDFTVNRYAS